MAPARPMSPRSRPLRRRLSPTASYYPTTPSALSPRRASAISSQHNRIPGEHRGPPGNSLVAEEWIPACAGNAKKGLEATMAAIAGAAWTAAVAVCLWALAAGTAGAQIMIVGNDEKPGWDAQGKPILREPGHDTLSI